MKTMTTMIVFWMTVASVLLGTAPTMAQHITGEPGSPSATIQIDGKQLPPPDPKFGGVIRDAALESKPWWAPRVVPPKDAPNVLLIITDDAGFGERRVEHAIVAVEPLQAVRELEDAALAGDDRQRVLLGRVRHVFAEDDDARFRLRRVGASGHAACAIALSAITRVRLREKRGRAHVSAGRCSRETCHIRKAARHGARESLGLADREVGR